MIELFSKIGIPPDVSTSASISQSLLHELVKNKTESLALNRQSAVNHPAISGGSGDPDMFKFLTPELNGHLLTQSGSSSTDSYGNIVINRDHQKKVLEEDDVLYAEDRWFEEGTPLTAVSAGSSTWNNQYVRGGSKPRQAGNRGLFNCVMYYRYFDSSIHLWLESEFIGVDDGYLTLPDQRYQASVGHCPDPAGNFRNNRPCGFPIPNPASPFFDSNCWVGFDPAYGGDYNNYVYGAPITLKDGY